MNKTRKTYVKRFINCVCGFKKEEELMVQCKLCLCWQHGHCVNFENIHKCPGKYVCATCKNPLRGRQSMPYCDQDRLKGQTPSFSFSSKENGENMSQNEQFFKTRHEIFSEVLNMQKVLYSVKLKINIAAQYDHPKLQLWAEKWEEPEQQGREGFRMGGVDNAANETGGGCMVGGTQKEGKAVETAVSHGVSPKPCVWEKDTSGNSFVSADGQLMLPSLICNSQALAQNSQNLSHSSDVLTRVNSPQTQSQVLPYGLDATQDTGASSPGEYPRYSKDTMRNCSKGTSENHGQSSSEPGKPVNPELCRNNLFDHIEYLQKEAETQLNSLETKIDDLEMKAAYLNCGDDDDTEVDETDALHPVNLAKLKNLLTTLDKYLK